MSSVRFSCLFAFWRDVAPVQLLLHMRRCLRLLNDVYGTRCMCAGCADIFACAADLILAFMKTARIRHSFNVIVDKNRRRDEYSGRRVELTEAS